MKTADYFEVLKKILIRLEGCEVVWALTGSLNFVLQGVAVEVHDIDLQTSVSGAYLLEKIFSEFVQQPIYERRSKKINSHYGKLLIDEVQVEIMGGLRKRLADENWEAPVEVAENRCWVELDGLQVPVLSLPYELEAYRKLGRFEKAALLERFLSERKAE